MPRPVAQSTTTGESRLYGSLHTLDPRAGAPTNLVRVPGRKDTLEDSNKRSNPNLGETVILTQGRTLSLLGLSDINGTGNLSKGHASGAQINEHFFIRNFPPIYGQVQFFLLSTWPQKAYPPVTLCVRPPRCS